MRKRIGLVGGSGLYALPGLSVSEEAVLETPFGEPSDAFVLGDLAGVPVAFLARHGRGHRFQPSEVNYRANVWGFKKLGCSYLVSSSACGSMKLEYAPTHIVLPDQLLDLTKGRRSTFFGEGCVAHVSFSHPFSTYLLEALASAAAGAGAETHRGGTYLCMEGPQFSTLAESRLYRSWGVDVIGMTNATEAKLCREAEIDYASMCLVTDYDCWHEEHGAVSVETILAVLRKNAETADRVLAGAVASLDPERPPDCDGALRHAVLTAADRIPREARQRLSLLMERYWR